MNSVELADLWQFPWPTMEVLIGGKSSIDLAELYVGSLEEATEFLRAYGYDPENPHDLRQMHCVLIEAIAFIETQLLLPREWNKGVRPPDEILFCSDPRYLLIWASSKEPVDRWRRRWACAVLRVMHTIAHLEGVNKSVDLGAARSQIFGRFRQHLWREPDESLWFGGPRCKVELAQVEWKESKSRNSIILKLLHKRDNVAETIYDYVGVRLITKRLCDVLLTVKILREYHIVVYPNAYPSRARNTLVDVERFRTQIETLREMLVAGTLSPAEFETMTARLTAAMPAAPVNPSNPHTASNYRSIQLTGRQLIKVPYHRFEWFAKINQDFAWVGETQAALAGQTVPAHTARMLSELSYMVEHWHSVKDSLYDAAFFPFEVQILELESFRDTQAGEADHDRYKQSQVRAARKRVLGKVLELAKSATGSGGDTGLNHED